MKSRSIEKLKASVGGRRSAVAQAAVYAGSAAAAATAGGAVITNVGLGLGAVSHPADGTEVPWDVDGDALPDFELRNCGSIPGGFVVKYDVMSHPSSNPSNDIYMLGGNVIPVNPADLVDGSLSFSDLSCGMRARDCDGQNLSDMQLFGASVTDNSFLTGTLGFRFFNDGAGIFNYGVATWEGFVDVPVLDGPIFGSFAITSWAYEDTGAGILGSAAPGAAPIPEPARVGLLALGLGAAGLRRRRRAARA